MATQYSNKPIVTDGLVYALDFGNPKSYVSGSTTANSLLYNPTTASVSASGLDNQGFLNLGTNNYVVTNQLYNLGYTSGYTIMYTVDPKGGQSNRESTQITQAGNANTQRFWSGISSTRVSHWFLPTTSVNSTTAYTGRRFNITPGKQHIAIRYSSGSYDLFRNGVPVSPSAGPNLGDAAAGGTLSIGLPSGYFGVTGSFAQFQVYDRALTSDEIWNNYRLSAQRYGIGTVSTKPYTLDENAYLFLQSAGITDPIITGSIDTFVRGLKANNLWDKMIAIYPFVGTGSDGVNLTGSQSWNLKEPTTAFYKLTYNGSWEGSTSGSAPSGSGTYINSGINPKSYHPYFLNNNAHISILSYDTPVSSSYLMGTGMTEDLAISTLAGDYGTPAAAYSVRKVRTAYSGALMDVRRSIDNVTQSIGFVDSGDLDTGSLLDWTIPGRNDLPGEYEGLAAAYSLRKVSASYDGFAVEVRRDWDNESGSFGFDANGELDTVSLLTFVTGSAGTGSGFVQTWYDQSGNNRHATQTATGSQPLIVSSGSLVTDNNKPALDFDGVNDFYNFPNLTPTSNDSIFLLGRRKTNSSNGIFLSNTGSSFPYRVGHFNNDEYQYQAVGYKLYGLSNTANQDLISAFANGYGSTGFLLYVNSIQPTLLEYGTSGYETPWNSIGSSNAFSNAYAQEILIYTSSQIDNRPLIENNINNYYNIYTGSNHGFVARWYDQSGNNRHATQTATGSQQVIVLSGSLLTMNSKPVAIGGLGYGIQNPTTHTNISTFTVGRGSTVFNLQSNLTRSIMWDSGVPSTKYFYIEQSGGDTFTNSVNPNYAIINGLPKSTTLNRGQVATEVENQSLISLNWNNINSQINVLGSSINDYNNYDLQEIIFYPTDQASNRAAIDYGINSYYNIYTQPTSSNWTTSSFTIQATPTAISGAINNRLTSGIPSSGPLGLITVSRTGSNSLTIARNGVTSSFAVPASGALSTGIYLGAINNNGIALGNSPLNLSFASVGTGLTGADVNNYTRLLTNLQFDLKRASLLNYYPEPFIAYSLRLLDINYTGPAIQVRRSSDNTTLDIGFNSRGLLDTEALLNFVGTGNGYIRIWYDQSGNQNNIGRTSNANQPIIVENGSVLLEAGKPTIRFDGGQSLYNQVGAFNTSVTSPFTILHTMKATGAGGLLDGDSTFEFGVRTLSDVSLDVNTSPGLRASYSNVRGQRNLFHYISNPNGNPTSMGVNTTQIAFKTTFNSITFTGVCLGAAYPIYNYVFGNMQEFIIYPYDMNANSTRLPVSSLINNYYQIY
jgi:hypothetical protein